MADYTTRSRTNYFSVKNPEAFHALLERLDAEDEVRFFEKQQPDGGVKYGFGCVGEIYGLESSDDDTGSDMDCFIATLQELVCEDNAIIITEIGYEGLRCLTGAVIVITSKEVKHLDLHTEAVGIAQKLLNNPGYQTEMEY